MNLSSDIERRLSTILEHDRCICLDSTCEPLFSLSPWGNVFFCSYRGIESVLRLIDTASTSAAENEIEFTIICSNNNISPKVLSYSKELSYVILKRLDSLDDKIIGFENKLVGKLKEIHNLNIDSVIESTVNKSDSVILSNYKSASDNTELSNLSEYYVKYKNYLNCKTRIVISHGDLNPGNILVDGTSFFFIDFDHVHHDSWMFDLATLSLWNTHTIDILEMYLDRPPTCDEKILFEVAKFLVLARYAFVTSSFIDFDTSIEEVDKSKPFSLDHTMSRKQAIVSLSKGFISSAYEQYNIIKNIVV